MQLAAVARRSIGRSARVEMNSGDSHLNGDCCADGQLVVNLLPSDATVDTGEKPSKRTRRKASRSKDDDNQYCVKSCKHNGNSEGSMVQCHFCQTWVHLECVGENDTEVVGIWTCKSSRIMPSMVERLLEKMSSLEELVMKLETSNQQLVTLVVEQRQEIQSLRDVVTSGGNRPYADVARSRPHGSTLVVGNSLLRDVRLDNGADGEQITIRRKSGATLKDIDQMIKEVGRTGNAEINKIVIVCGTRETIDNVSTTEIKEELGQLLENAKTMTPVITVSSVLPWRKRANPEHLAEINNALRATCADANVTFVDQEANFTFRNGNIDESAFHADGRHLSTSGVGRLL